MRHYRKLMIGCAIGAMVSLAGCGVGGGGYDGPKTLQSPPPPPPPTSPPQDCKIIHPWDYC